MLRDAAGSVQRHQDCVLARKGRLRTEKGARTSDADLGPRPPKMPRSTVRIRASPTPIQQFPPAELMTFDDLRRDRTLARHPVPILESHVLHCQWHNYTHGPSTARAHQYAIPHFSQNPASSVVMSATYTPICPLINTPSCRPCRLNLCKFPCNPNLDVFPKVAL